MAEPFRKDGKWAFRVDIGPDPATGKRRQMLRQGFPTKKAAADAQTDLMARVRGAQVVARSTSSVREYLNKWLETQPMRVRPTTLHGYAMACRRIESKVGATRLQALSVIDVEAMYAGLLADGLSTKTVLNTHQVLRRALQDAVRTGLLATNPAAVAEAPSHTRPEMATWTAEQVAEFLAFTAEDELHPLWVLLLASGMRRGEVLGVRWTDVDLRSGEVRIVQTRTTVGGTQVVGEPKTKKSRRSLALEPEHVAVLKDLRRLQAAQKLAVGDVYDTSHDLVFRDSLGVPYKPDRVSRAFTAAVAASGLPKITIHSCRHTWASVALTRGVAMKTVADQLGHASITVTADIYSHVAPDLARGAVRTVTAGFLSKAPGER